ncbi:cohesin domain-containing protein, partial [Okeania hirsuta]
MRDIMAFQFTLQYDTEGLSFVGVEGGGIPNMSENNFGLRYLEQGLITGSWNESTDADIGAKETLFRMTFRAERAIQ